MVIEWWRDGHGHGTKNAGSRTGSRKLKSKKISFKIISAKFIYLDWLLK